MSALKTQTRHTQYYANLARKNSENYPVLQNEYGQIKFASERLTEQTDKTSSASLLEFIPAVAPFLLATSLHADLLNLCETGFQATKIAKKNAGWLWLLKAKSSFAMGEWNRALTEAHQAITDSRNIDPATYAEAVLTVGKMQLNSSDYNLALKTLADARKLFTDVSDNEGIASALAEFAAYYLNRGEDRKALQLYQEADRIRGKVKTSEMPDHSLLMMGVVYRKLGQSNTALDYLTELLERGESRKLDGQIATAKHHIAWVYIQEKRIAEACQYAEQARELYTKIDDPRGLSDADEQMGDICLHEGNTAEAKRWLLQSIRARQQLGNRHGTASSFRRLALVFFQEGSPISGMWYMARSFWLYARMDMLSRERLYKLFKNRRLS